MSGGTEERGNTAGEDEEWGTLVGAFVCPDRSRLRIFRRADGRFVYSEGTYGAYVVWYEDGECEAFWVPAGELEQVAAAHRHEEEFAIRAGEWRDSGPSGLYGTALAAERDARARHPWMENASVIRRSYGHDASP